MSQIAPSVFPRVLFPTHRRAGARLPRYAPASRAPAIRRAPRPSIDERWNQSRRNVSCRTADGRVTSRCDVSCRTADGRVFFLLVCVAAFPGTLPGIMTPPSPPRAPHLPRPRLPGPNSRAQFPSNGASGILTPCMYSLILVRTEYIQSTTMPCDGRCTYLVILANVSTSMYIQVHTE